ncbi:coiled-coil domain-containing protein 57 isoform X1 [Saccopteryx bilineata]|uniref:coiled-coil domain-containing protein 57 isoform X1 n=1 Tax=Saccopteryx bilineata TaxID=59482 RepID=UPI00338DF51B
MLLPPSPLKQALNELLARKEEEWREQQAHRSQKQEVALQDAHSQLEEAQVRLRRLQEDFVYNLQVLEERDRELEHYDTAFAQAQRLEESLQAEVSELKIEVTKLRQMLSSEALRLEELQLQHQQKLQEHHLELERIHSDKNSELDYQREQYEQLKWKLERKLEELEGKLAQQRQELLLEFESEMQKREHRFRLHADSVSSVVLLQELKVKLLNKELAALREAGAQAAESLQSAQAANSELADRLQHAAWELKDLATMKDARIKDLEDKLQSVHLTWKKEEEMLRRKHEELDRMARERDTVLVSVKGAHTEQLQALEARVLELQAQCEALELQVRRAEWRQVDALKEKDAAMDKLQEEALALRSGWDAQVAQLSKEMTFKDLQVQSLQEEEAQLKTQLARCQQDIGRYQRQLSLAVEREQNLEHDKVQLNLDWQRRCDSLEREYYRKSEELIQGLTMAREQVAAKLQETERKLCDQEVVLKAMTLERDQALQALKTYRPIPEQEVQTLLRHQEGEVSGSFPSEEIQQLQEQNASLRDCVTQMRREMEALSEQVLPPASQGADTAPACQLDAKAADTAPDYVLALEAEIWNLKCKFKALEEQLGDVGPSKMPLSHTDDQPSVHSKMEAPGGAMPANGASMGMGLALRQLGNRAHLLSFLVTQLREKCLHMPQVLQEPLEVDTVQCELPNVVDHVHLEVLELQKQVAELEKHLGMVCQDGKGPLTGPQLHTPDTVAPGRQGPAAGGPEALSVQRLQRKLKEAVCTVLRLHLEKEQLLELGNRLRAELGWPAGKPPPRPLSPEGQHPREKTEASLQQGPPLGQLQPHLTSQDSKNAKEEHFSTYSGKIQPHAATAVCRNDAQRGSAAGPAGPGQKQHKISTATCKSTRQKENQSPKPQQAHKFHQDSSHHTHRSSSLASSSLQDTWKLLELGSNPSGRTSQDNSAPERTALPAAHSPRHLEGSPIETWAAFAIKGMKVEAQTKAKPARPSRAHSAKPKGCQRPPKIWNYNFKD